MVCCFIGHRDAPSSIIPELESTLIDLIENKNVDYFLVGTHGGFDSMVVTVLKKLKDKYSHICYNRVLAYMPGKKYEFEPDPDKYDDTIYPEGLETVQKRYAIIWRNKWMVRQSDFLVAYVNRSWGGASLILEYAKKRDNLEVINLA